MYKVYETNTAGKVMRPVAFKLQNDTVGGVQLVAVYADNGMAILGGNILHITKNGELERYRDVGTDTGLVLTPSRRIQLIGSDPMDD